LVGAIIKFGNLTVTNSFARPNSILKKTPFSPTSSSFRGGKAKARVFPMSNEISESDGKKYGGPELILIFGTMAKGTVGTRGTEVIVIVNLTS